MLKKISNAILNNYSVKIYISFLALMIIVSVAFTSIFVHNQKQTLTDALIKKGLSLVELASYNAKLGVFTENPEFLEDVLEGIMKQEEVLSFDILSSDGRILSSKGGHHDIDVHQLMENLNKSGSPYFMEYPDHFEFMSNITLGSDIAPEESLFYETNLTEERVIGFIRLGISKKKLIGSINKSLRDSIVILVIFIFIGSLVTFLLTRSITMPLIQLNKGVKAIGEGNLTTQLTVTTRDDIGKLAIAFNEMVRLLKKREEEKQRLSEQLNQSLRLEAIATLTAGIAHDFNNILSIIQSNMQLAERKVPDYVKDYIEKSLKATKRGSELVTRLMNFTDGSPLTISAVNIKLIANETIHLYENQMDSSIDVALDAQPDLWRAKGDAGQIQQIMINLYENACDAVMERAMNNERKADNKENQHLAINISLKNITLNKDNFRNNPNASEGDYVLLSVEDNGCGMDNYSKQHMFEPFFTTKKSGSGTGLGLSTVYGIVKNHRGWIDVKSEVGTGTAFNVYLPRFTGENAESEQTQQPHEYIGGSETILLVDDETHILDAMKEKLEELGYMTITADSGEKAVEMLKKNKDEIALVILDYILPDISGVEVYQFIRKNKLKSKVIMHSGKDLGQISDFLDDVEYIQKPASLDELSIKVREVLGPEQRYPLRAGINRVKFYYLDEKTIPYNEELTDVETAYKLFRNIANEPRENFIALYLTANNKILAYDKLSSGTINKVVVYPREVVKGALFTNAASVILIHNHPSGDLHPSENDIIITAAIVQACQVMDINVLDHLIISRDDYYSFSRNGDL